MEQAARAHVVGLGALGAAGKPRTTARRRRRRASAPGSRRAGERGQPSCGGRRARPAGYRDTPAGCGPSNPPVRHTQAVRFPLPSAVEQAAANDDGRHQVTTAVDGAAQGGCCAFEDGAKKWSVGSSRFHVATKPGDKSGAPVGLGWEGR